MMLWKEMPITSLRFLPPEKDMYNKGSPEATEGDDTAYHSSCIHNLNLNSYWLQAKRAMKNGISQRRQLLIINLCRNINMQNRNAHCYQYTT